MKHIRWIVLFALASTATAQTYYNKTTIPPTISANTILGNGTAITNAPQQLSIASCSTSSSALKWTTSSGFSCNTSINAATLGGATFASPGTIGGTTPGSGTFSTLTDTAITGSVQCIHVDGSGVFSGTGSDCGSGGGSVANPTGTIGLTAVNGSASSAIRSDGAPALSQTIVPTWSGLHTFSAGLTSTNIGNATTLTKSGSSVALGQFGILQQITSGGSPTGGADNAYVNLFKITDNQDTSGASDPGRSGGMSINYVIGTSSKRGKEAFATTLTAAGPNGDAGVSSRNYVGITSYVTPVAMGGTGPSDLEGIWYGGNTNITNGPAASNNYTASIIGWEHDIGNRDPTTGNVIGELISFTAAYTERAVKQNMGLIIASAATQASGEAGLDCAVCIGNYSGYWPMDANGSVFSDWKNADLAGIGQNTSTVANLFYFPALTITGYAISTPGFTVDGSGNLTAASVSGAGGGKFPYMVAQGALPFVLPGSGTMGNNGALSAVPALAATVAKGYVFAYPGTIGNATAASVTISGTGGQFACTCTGFAIGQYVTLSGTYGGTGSITGYTDPTTYYVSATNGTSTFTLQTTGRNPLTTTAGTPTGITYNAGGGWFYATGSSTTAYTLFNNIYVTGQPAIPASPTAFSTTGIGAYTATVNTITWWGPQFTVAGGSLGLNGAIDAQQYLKYSSSANTKTATMVMGATTILSATPTATTSVGQQGHMTNVGDEAVQEGWQTQVNSSAAAAISENTAGATNTAVDVVLSLRLKLANAGDTLELVSYSAEERPN